VPWLFLLAWWVLALIVTAALYAAWNRTGLSLHLAVANTTPAPGSPAEDLPEQLLRTGPLPAPVFEGDGFGLEVGLRAKNGARGPVWAVGQVVDKPVWAGTGLVPKTGWSSVKDLRALRRGPVGARAWRLNTSDPLGFFLGLRRSPDSEVALILPRFTSLSERRTSRELEASMAAPRAGSGNELFGIREYRAGDSLRRIHWRSSARRGDLVVREYEPPGLQTLAILVDPSPPTTDVADQIARIAASEAWDCLREGGRVVVWAPGHEPVQARDLWTILEWLARYPAGASGPEGHLATNGEEAVVMTSSADAELLAAAEGFRRRRAWVIGDVQLDIDAEVERVGTTWPL
jgi:uncharacterized protein (DUF58 family)